MIDLSIKGKYSEDNALFKKKKKKRFTERQCNILSLRWSDYHNQHRDRFHH